MSHKSSLAVIGLLSLMATPAAHAAPTPAQTIFASNGQPVNMSDMRLTLSENFKSTLATNIWSPFYPTGRAGNNQPLPDEYQILPGGGLRLRGDRRAYNGRPYAVGVITSFGGFSQTYGYFEMSAKVPAGSGSWPAFWLLPIDQSWPPEIDVMEWQGNVPTLDYATLHYGSANDTIGSTCATSKKENLSDNYHVYGIIWRPNQLTWTLDGAECFSTTKNVPSKPMYILANMALDGWYENKVKANSPFPYNFDISYIRAYQFTDSPAEVAPPLGFGKTIIRNQAGEVLPAGAVVQPGQVLEITTTAAIGSQPLTGVEADAIIISDGPHQNYGTFRAATVAKAPAHSNQAFPITVTVPKTIPAGLYDIAVQFSGNAEVAGKVQKESVSLWVAQEFTVQTKCSNNNGATSTSCLAALPKD